MKRIGVVILIAGMLVLMASQPSPARNRFNIITYHDAGNTINNLDSFYVWLDQFGASVFFAHDTFSAHYFTTLDTLIDIELSCQPSQTGVVGWQTHSQVGRS